jgi:DNA replication protein DnaC
MSSGDEIVTVLRTLGIRSSEDALRAFLKHAIQSRLGPVETLEHLAGIEQRERERRNLERRTRSAQLGQTLPIDRFDWSHARKLDRALMQSLLRLDFIEHGENVLFRGPSGVGKTTLARALGHAALEQGFVVRFSTLAAFLTDLLRQESAPALERRLKRYITPDVLILDEVGYLPCDSKAADLLYAVIDRRHEQRSTIVTTNLSFKQWGTVFPGAACIVALVDRFAQHCHAVDIDAESWRQKHAVTREPRDPADPTRPRPKRRRA